MTDVFNTEEMSKAVNSASASSYTFKFKTLTRPVSKDALMVSGLFRGMIEDDETEGILDVTDNDVMKPVDEALMNVILDLCVYEADTGNQKLKLQKPIEGPFPTYIVEGNPFYEQIIRSI